MHSHKGVLPKEGINTTAIHFTVLSNLAATVSLSSKSVNKKRKLKGGAGKRDLGRRGALKTFLALKKTIQIISRSDPV